MHPEFPLVHESELTASTIIEHPVWATYYEPDDLSSFAAIGLDPEEILKALQKVRRPDEYLIPLPYLAATVPFKYVYLTVTATSPRGTELVGLRTRVSLRIFHGNFVATLNRALKKESLENVAVLEDIVGKTGLLPLKLFYVGSGITEIFDL